MWKFLLENPDTIVTALGALAGWLGLRRRSDGLDQIKRKLTTALRAAAVRIAADPSAQAKAEQLLRSAAWTTLGHLGIAAGSKRWAPVVDLLVDEIEVTVHELYLQRALAGLASGAARVSQTLGKAPR